MLTKKFAKKYFSVFNLEKLPEDPIFGIMSQFNKDTNPNKISLTAGTYKTDENKPFILNCVRKAQELIVEKKMDHEYLGIEDRLPEHFLDNTTRMPGLTAFLEKGGIIYVIPVINPDGFTRKRRLNENGADLNRDFDLLPRNDARFTQPETRALADFLERDLTASGAKLRLSLDYHCCLPAMIIPWSYIDAQPEQKDQSSFHTLGGIGRSVLGFPYGNAMETVNYLAEGSSIDYFYAKYGTLSLAVEGSWRGEEGNLAKHVDFWDKLFQSLADQR